MEYPGLHPWKGLRPFKRHSLVLMVAGLVYVAVGVSYIIMPTTPYRAETMSIALSWMSFDSWGVVWLAAGAMAIISSRWPPISKTWGYMVLTGLASGWAAFYFTAWCFADAPSTNLLGTLSWGLLGFMWWAISGLLNPNDVRLTIVRDDRSDTLR